MGSASRVGWTLCPEASRPGQEAIERSVELNPRVMGIDLRIAEPREVDDREALGRKLVAEENVIGGMVAPSKRLDSDALEEVPGWNLSFKFGVELCGLLGTRIDPAFREIRTERCIHHRSDITIASASISTTS